MTTPIQQTHQYIATSRIYWGAILIIIVSLLLSACGGGSAEETKKTTPAPPKTFEPDKVLAIARIEPETKIASLSSEVAGIVKRVLVKAGDTVAADQVLVELSDILESSQVSQNQAAIAVTQAQRNDITASLQSADTRATNLRRRWERLRNAAAQNAETQQNVDNALTEYQTTLKETERLKAQLEANAKQVAQLQAQTQVSEVSRNRRRITAPTAGIILSMDLQAGEAVQALAKICEFAPQSPTVALCEVDELFADKVQLGQSASVRLVGSTTMIAEGKVIFISPYLRKKSLFSDAGGDLEDRRVREVKIRLNNPKGLLYGQRVESLIKLK